MSYQLPDEPEPGALSAWVVNPFWILLACMLAGPWLAWPWYVFNAYAIGQRDKRRVALAAGAALVVTVAAAAGLGFLAAPVGDALGLSPETVVPYLRILHTTLELGIAYVLYLMQSDAFGLHEYFGGTPRSGMLPLAAGFLLRVPLARFLEESGLGLLLLLF